VKRAKRVVQPIQVTDRPKVTVGEAAAVQTSTRKPFRVTPIDMMLPKEWTSGCVSELLEMLEGPEYH
jgi:hypothetical protein